ncbi:hypothetical protein BC826DRAFT_1175831 [Russula brevipes]|nr:hypothetical protein BC826DRAFT_1175831 [Russula brevipes]
MISGLRSSNCQLKRLSFAQYSISDYFLCLYLLWTLPYLWRNQLSSDDMAPPSFALLAFLHSMRSSNLRRNFRILTSRCLLLWLRILGKLRKIWSWYFRTSSNGGKKTEEITGRHSSTRPLWKHEEYSAVCASRVFGGIGGSSRRHSMSESSIVQESIELEAGIGQSQSVSHSPSLSSAPSMYYSIRAESPGSFRGSTIHRSSTPVPWAHPHAAATQFTGTSLHSRSRSPSPSRSLLHRRRARQDTPERVDIDTDTSRPLVMVQNSSDSPETSTHPSPGNPIHVQPPSRAGAMEMGSPSQPPLSSISIHGQAQDLPTIPQAPSIEALNSSAVSSSPKWYGPLVYGAHGSSRHSSGGIRTGSSTPRSGQVSQHSIAISEPFASGISVQIPTNASGAQLVQLPITALFSQSSTSPISIQTSVTNASGVQTGAPFPIPFPQPSISRVSISVSANYASGTQPGVCEWRAMHPEQVSRYVKKGDVPKKENPFRLSPMDVNLPHSYIYNQDMDDWVPFTHPEGALYFYHKSWRIFTDVYMYDPELRAEVHEFARLLNEEVLKLVPNVSPWPTNNYEIVIDIVETKDNSIVWKYYFVDHNNKILFWVDPYDISSQLYEIPGVTEPGHIKYRLESLYWMHWSLYPIGYEGRKLPVDACEEVLGILLSTSINSLTSRVSTAPYSVADMKTMCDMMKEARKFGPDNAHVISSAARLLSSFVHWRFVHFHGQKTARLDRSKSIYAGGGHKRTKPFQTISLFLFFHPDVHLRELKKVWVDELVYDETWRNFMVMLQSEWEGFILNLTVMLAANVSFLAIPGVIPSQVNAWARPSSAQVASCMSLVFSLGGIISGLLLIRSTHALAGEDTRTAWNYLNGKNMPHFHLEPLAITYSLPYGLLMWSVSAFFIALLLITFSKTREEIRIPVGVTVGLVGILVIWCIVNLWDQRGDSESE